MKKKILLIGIICGLLAAALPLKVQAGNEIISYIYHSHQGDSKSKGGCYGQPVYHVHQGDGISGGDCYQQAIYHQHQGNAGGEGGCYTVPVYHSHEGSDDAAGGCFVEQFHEHDSSCHTTTTCTIRVSSYSYCFRTWYGNCYHHGESVQGEWYAVMSHSSCGQGDFNGTITMCNSCRHIGTNDHDYKKLTCSRENELIGYSLGCGMDETTIVSYDTGCNRQADQDIDGYGLTCEKNGESIDSYALNCGKETTVPLGYVKITNLTNGLAEEAELEASYWDRTASEGKNGDLKISSNPFVWEDDDSQKIGESSRISVGENGNYTVSLQAENQDIKREGLTVTIQVSNIKPPSPDDGTGNGGDNQDDQDGGDSQDSQNNIEPERNDKVVATETPNPAVTPQSSTKTVKRVKAAAVPTASPTQTISPIKIEKKEIKIPELEAEPEAVEIAEIVTETSFWQTPAAKALVITLSSALVLLGLLGLWILLFRYVGIYGEDGEGNECFLGIGLIRREETFLLVIPEHVLDRACTSRYCLRPGLLFYKMHEQSELVVEAKNKKVSLVIEKEIKFKY